MVTMVTKEKAIERSFESFDQQAVCSGLARF
jgi:hypothetical protein